MLVNYKDYASIVQLSKNMFGQITAPLFGPGTNRWFEETVKERREGKVVLGKNVLACFQDLQNLVFFCFKVQERVVWALGSLAKDHTRYGLLDCFVCLCVRYSHLVSRVSNFAIWEKSRNLILAKS